MTHPSDLPQPRASLRGEAADWFALMRGPDADTRRVEFEAWLDAHAIHREAYNRIAETFSLGKALKGPGLGELAGALAPPAARPKMRRTSIAVLLLAAAVIAAMTWGTLRQNEAFVPRPQIAQAAGVSQRLATRIGEIRRFRLADGSFATLDTASLIVVTYSAGNRQISLAQGRARFEVAHERRPFVVTAQGGSVTAVGTVFDVALGNRGEVEVRLLKGVVDVAAPARASSNKTVRRLVAGQTLSFSAAAAPTLTKMGAAADAEWPAGLRSFSGVRLAEVLAEANRYGTLSLRADQSDAADLRISGTFRIDNPRMLASNLAQVLGLAQVTTASEIVLTRSCPAAPNETGPKESPAKENCVPAS